MSFLLKDDADSAAIPPVLNKAALPNMPLSDKSRQPVASCKVCGGRSPLFDVVDFNKVCAEPNRYLYGLVGVPVYYHRCESCGFISTEFFDEWETDDFRKHIYNEDYLKVDGDFVSQRPVAFAEKIAGRFPSLAELRILDFGSGSGALAARLAELGATDIASYDPYFQPARPEGKFDLIICLEAIQHSPHPKRFMEDMKNFAKDDAAIIIASAMQPGNIDAIRGNWISIAPRNGHFSLLTDRALVKLAQNIGFVFCEGNGLMALVTPQPSGIMKIVSQAVGPVVITVALSAPGQDVPAWRRAAIRSQWRDIESSDRGPFRWTADNQIEFPIDALPYYPARLRIFIPIILELVPGFASNAAIGVGRNRERCIRTSSGIIADINIDEHDDHTLVLETPPLLSPNELGTVPGDKRKLGIGVPVLNSDLSRS